MPKEVRISDLRREDRVTFRYEGRGRVLDVDGTVDKISKDAIYVGNESWESGDGLEIFHTSKYLVEKIQRIEKI